MACGMGAEDRMGDAAESLSRDPVGGGEWEEAQKARG